MGAYFQAIAAIARRRASGGGGNLVPVLVDTFASTSAGGTSFSLDATGVTSGDLLIVSFPLQGNITVSGSPTGFTEHRNIGTGTSSTSLRHHVYTKVSDGSETTLTFTLSGGVDGRVAHLVSVSGSISETSTAFDSGVTDVNSASVTVSAGGCAIVLGGAFDRDAYVSGIGIDTGPTSLAVSEASLDVGAMCGYISADGATGAGFTTHTSNFRLTAINIAITP